MDDGSQGRHKPDTYFRFFKLAFRIPKTTRSIGKGVPWLYKGHAVRTTKDFPSQKRANYVLDCPEISVLFCTATGHPIFRLILVLSVRELCLIKQDTLLRLYCVPLSGTLFFKTSGHPFQGLALKWEMGSFIYSHWIRIR
jgi:hypothetical protein